MPYRFNFKSDDGVFNFQCPLQCMRCTATNKGNDQRCSRTTCIGTPYCWSHLLREKGLRIRVSEIPNAGKGLFAFHRPGAPIPNDDIVFRKNEDIVEYAGQQSSEGEMDARYGDYTAPYGLSQDAHWIDAACLRGAGSLANGAAKGKANAEYYFNDEDGKFYLRATKNIKNGSEILCNYGEDYGGKNKKKKKKSSAAAYSLHQEPVKFSTKPFRRGRA